MISECMNPACRRELVYLRNGRVVRIMRESGGIMRIEHFWLCGECFLRFDFRFLPNGEVQIVPRPSPANSGTVVDLPLSA